MTIILCRGRRFVLLLPPREPCPTVAELQVNRSTPGSTVTKRIPLTPAVGNVRNRGHRDV